MSKKQKKAHKNAHENPIMLEEDLNENEQDESEQHETEKNEGKKAESHKQEFKEYIDRDRQVGLLKSWLDALEGEHDLEIDLQDQHCTIPAEAFAVGDTRIEYEYDEKKGKYELELTMKWR